MCRQLKRNRCFEEILMTTNWRDGGRLRRQYSCGGRGDSLSTRLETVPVPSRFLSLETIRYLATAGRTSLGSKTVWMGKFWQYKNKKSRKAKAIILLSSVVQRRLELRQSTHPLGLKQMFQYSHVGEGTKNADKCVADQQTKFSLALFVRCEASKLQEATRRGAITWVLTDETFINDVRQCLCRND